MKRRVRNKKGQFTSDIVSVFVKNNKKFKICTMCKEEKEVSEFYWIKKKDRPTSRCKKCTNKITAKNQHKYKEYYKNYWETHKEENSIKNQKYYNEKRKNWIKYISTIIDIKCKKCGYDKYFDALDFHHPDPSMKEYELNPLMKLQLTEERKNKILKELEKGFFLCANCHREEHMTNRIKLKEYITK